MDFESARPLAAKFRRRRHGEAHRSQGENVATDQVLYRPR
jgi:hypothetical protein